MKLENYVTLNEEGKPVYNYEAFNADLDRERNSASETSRANTEKKLRKEIEADVRKNIEEEAKLSAEEKLQQERVKLDEERKAFNKERILHLYKADGLFSDKEISTFEKLITNDYDASLEEAKSIVADRKASREAYEKSLKEQLQMGLPRGGGFGDKGNENVGLGAKFADRIASQMQFGNGDSQNKT